MTQNKKVHTGAGTHENERKDQARDKKKHCGKKEEIGDILCINPYKTAKILGKTR
jgi:hypothetical protein